MNLNKIKGWYSKNEPSIMIATGIAALLSYGIDMAICGIKAHNACQAKREELQVSKLSVKETIKTGARYFLVPGVLGVMGTGLILTGNRIHTKRNAALFTAYSITEATLQKVQDKTKEIVGEKKANEIQEAVAKDKIKESTGNTVLISDGSCRFIDDLTKQRLTNTNWNKIQRIANELNSQALTSMCGRISKNDWLDALGLETVADGDFIGWSIEDGSQGLIDISLDTALDENNMPCGLIRYNNRPKEFK